MTTIKVPVYNEITEEYEKEMKDFDTKNLDPNGDRFNEEMIKEKNKKERGPSKNPAFSNFTANLPESFDNFVTFKNASDEYWNDPICINKSHITSFFGNPGTGRTIIFSGYSNQSWEVQEDLETVSNFIKGKK